MSAGSFSIDETIDPPRIYVQADAFYNVCSYKTNPNPNATETMDTTTCAPSLSTMDTTTLVAKTSKVALSGLQIAVKYDGTRVVLVGDSLKIMRGVSCIKIEISWEIHILEQLLIPSLSQRYR